MKEAQRTSCDIRFNETKHLYYISSKGNWKRVPSVTAVTRLFAGNNKVFRLQQWAARLAAESMADSLSHEFTEEERGLALSKAKRAFTQEFERSGTIGTKVHSLIAATFNGTEFDLGSVYLKEIHKCMDRFDDWLHNHQELEPVEIEGMIANPVTEYAGTFDLLARNKETNELELIDFKTRADLRLPEDALQLTAYMGAWEACMDEPISRARLVRLPKAGLKLPTDYVIAHPNDQHMDAFNALLYLYNWNLNHF